MLHRRSSRHPSFSIPKRLSTRASVFIYDFECIRWVVPVCLRVPVLRDSYGYQYFSERSTTIAAADSADHLEYIAWVDGPTADYIPITFPYENAKFLPTISISGMLDRGSPRSQHLFMCAKMYAMMEDQWGKTFRASSPPPKHTKFQVNASDDSTVKEAYMFRAVLHQDTSAELPNWQCNDGAKSHRRSRIKFWGLSQSPPLSKSHKETPAQPNARSVFHRKPGRS